MTAKEFAEKFNFYDWDGIDYDNIYEYAREFAKFHVKAAIKAIEEGKGEHSEFYYPLENIK